MAPLFLRGLTPPCGRRTLCKKVFFMKTSSCFSELMKERHRYIGGTLIWRDDTRGCFRALVHAIQSSATKRWMMLYGCLQFNGKREQWDPYSNDLGKIILPDRQLQVR